MVVIVTAWREYIYFAESLLYSVNKSFKITENRWKLMIYSYYILWVYLFIYCFTLVLWKVGGLIKCRRRERKNKLLNKVVYPSSYNYALLTHFCLECLFKRSDVHFQQVQHVFGAPYPSSVHLVRLPSLQLLLFSPPFLSRRGLGD